MRDNHDKMPELLTAYERGGQFFGSIAVTLDSECRQFEFGVSQCHYTELRRILQFRPFDNIPGIHYRYFIADSVRRLGDERVELIIRIEQAHQNRQFKFEIPLALAANLLWFSRLRDFTETAHLKVLT